LLRIVVRLSFLHAVLLRNYRIDELFQVDSVAVLVRAQNVLESAISEFHIDIDSLEILHVLFIEVFLCLILRQKSVIIFIKTLEG
jgi:hypothetical protein